MRAHSKDICSSFVTFEDLGDRALHGGRGGHPHAGGDQRGDLVGQGLQGHGVQAVEAQRVELAGQLLGAQLADPPARGAAGGEFALAGADPSIDGLHGLLRLGVHRLGAHRQVAAGDGHDGGEDPVVESVGGAVDHVGARGQARLEIVPHELEDAGRHVEVPDDVVRRTHQPLARVPRQRVEGAVRPLNDPLRVRGREEDVIGVEEPLVADLRLHLIHS